MEFSEGDKIIVIDENLEGEVVADLGDKVKFQCPEGFDYIYEKHLVIRIDAEGNSRHHAKDSDYQEKEQEKTGTFSPKIILRGSKPEVDLHIEEIAPHLYFKHKHQALEFQLNYCREVISKASSARLRKMIFIHGRGRGVLREKLRKMLAVEYPHIEYFDGNYMRYGSGATEIIIHGLGKA